MRAHDAKPALPATRQPNRSRRSEFASVPPNELLRLPLQASDTALGMSATIAS
jgi:hypothetical protein